MFAADTRQLGDIRLAADTDFPLTLDTAQAGQAVSLSASPTTFFFNASGLGSGNVPESFPGLYMYKESLSELSMLKYTQSQN